MEANLAFGFIQRVNYLVKTKAAKKNINNQLRLEQFYSIYHNIVPNFLTNAFDQTLILQQVKGLLHLSKYDIRWTFLLPTGDIKCYLY